MENYIQIPINNYKNINNIINFNLKLDLIKNIMLNNKNIGNNSIVDLNCNICYEIKMPSNFKTLRCNHKLCKSCYEKWCNINVSCPYCRAVIS